MQENFYRSGNLSKEKLKLLSKKSDYPAIVRFLVMYILFLAISVLLILSWNYSWWMLSLFLLGFGILGCSLFACEHETIHNTAFNAKSLNRAAAFLCGIGHWYAPSAFRDLHFTHHRYTHEIGKDPEISLGSRPMPSPITNLPSYLGWLSGFPLIIFKTFMLLSGAIGMPNFIQKQFFPFVRKEAKVRIAIESIVILLIQTSIAMAAILYHPGFWGLLIGQVVAHCFLASYLVMEHNGLPHEGNILNKTRSIKTNGMVKLLMWNMPYHAEHHAYPSIPFHQLPSLQQEIWDELVNKEESHFQFHLKVLKGKFSISAKNNND
ncbi:MAG: fatty acid desaturase [Flavobacteriales bacterium]|nr:fatty acid desaturase [Flavobacteriales bacterium]